jgi:RNA-directed DNA polymerase
VLLTNGSKAFAHEIRNRLYQFLQDDLQLELNLEKTKITHAKDGFDFLGFHIQWVTQPRNKPWLRVTPSIQSIRRFKAKIREMTAANRGHDAPDQKIAAINMVTRGWIYYYRYSNVKAIAGDLDFWISRRFTKWAKRKHDKGIRYVLRLYEARQTDDGRDRLNLRVINAHGKPLWLFKMSDVTIERYQDRALSSYHNPYLDTTQKVPTSTGEKPLDENTWSGSSRLAGHRDLARNAREESNFTCQQCGRSLLAGEIEQLDTHHRVPQSKGGQHHSDNMKVLCQKCHVKAHKG